MAGPNRIALIQTMHRLGRYARVVGPLLAAVFVLVALLTALSVIGSYPTDGARYLVAGLFTVFALVSLGIGLSVRPILRWVLRRV